MPQNFVKFPPYFCLQYIQTRVRWRFHKNLWPSQNIWTLWSVLTEISVSLSTENFCAKQMKQANLYLTYNAQAEIRILNFIYCQFMKYTYLFFILASPCWHPSKSKYLLLILSQCSFHRNCLCMEKMIDLLPVNGSFMMKKQILE